MISSLRNNWPEYLMEGWALGTFLFSAGVFAILLMYSGSPLNENLSDLTIRFLFGVVIGLTAIGIIYSPWGKQSGAHMNPGVTLAFFLLGKIKPWDATFYVVAHFIGALIGLLLVALFMNKFLSDPSVNYIVTAPGEPGAGFAFLAELLMSFLVMLAVLYLTNHDALAKYTGITVGLLLLIYITWEAPYSGMSINTARSIASNLAAWDWPSVWVYVLGPPLGMVLAGLFFSVVKSREHVKCAKLHHQNDKRCIFNCDYTTKAN